MANKLLQKATIIVLIALLTGTGVASAQSDDERFLFEDVPETVAPFDDFTFTLKALDEAGEVDTSYTGTVTFYADTDTNAIFPEDYTFEPEDAGEHTFSDVAFFSEGGIHTLIVEDFDDEALYGEVVVEVVDESEDSEDGVLSVLSPTDGVSADNIISFSGTADAGLEVRIFDNDTILAVTDADTDGDFFYQSPPLQEGDHTFYLETDTAISENIIVSIDTSSAAVTSITFSPELVSAGELTTVSVTLETEASAVAVIIDGSQTDLTEEGTLGRTFSGVVAAPDVAGEYDVAVKIVDAVGSEESVTMPAALSVGTGDAGAGSGSDSGTGSFTFFVPSQVTTVQLTPGDQRVTLSWSPATDDTAISHYTILYGTSADSLTSFVNTNDPSTTWYIPGLTNDQAYYFQVFGVDDEGNRGDQGSTVVAAMPSSDGGTTLHGTSSGQVRVDQTSETGPGGLVVLAFASAWGARRLSRRKR